MKKISQLILTVVFAVILSVSAFTAGTLVSIKVDPTIKILVNGKEFKPKDVNGKDVMTFVYDGTTYAPLRALAEAYGLEVGWDNEQRMATVNKPHDTDKTEHTAPTTVTLGMKNALAKARTYLNYIPFSYKGMINQLEFDGYTHEEAVYGADNCDADWYEQAVRKARQYLNLMSFSRSGLINQLEFDGFTPDQAEYAANQMGY